MGIIKANVVAAFGSALVALGLLYVLRWFVPPGIALAISLTTGLAWGQYRLKRRCDLAIVPITIALALGIAQFFSDEARVFIVLVFLIAGSLAGLWVRLLWPEAAADEAAPGRPAGFGS